MNQINRVRVVTVLATMYILLAFIWWTVLLFRKNEDAHSAFLQAIRLQLKAEGKYIDETQLKTTPPYLDLQQLQTRHNRMIWSEGSVLFLGLLWGIWAINQGFRKEAALANQRRNFLLSITHELKSPIASIQLILQTFQKRKLEEDKFNHLVNSANKEADRLNELVNNLLLSAKLETAYEPVFEEMNVANVLTEIVSKIKIRFPKADIRFIKNEVPILRGDRQGIISIFTNLIENAVKYSPDHATVQVKYAYENDKFLFEIADNGIGIPNNEKKKIFEKFYRIGSEETRKTKGTGLGLYIVNQIVKAHHGTIQVLDNDIKGTIFKIIIPS